MNLKQKWDFESSWENGNNPNQETIFESGEDEREYI
jgi:hypothetical protein